MSIINLFTAPFLKKNVVKDSSELVSVLIPARNEERYIEKCIRNVMMQTYSNLEIVIYDDSSTDGTNSIVIKTSKEDKRVKIINGESLPDGWRGKNFACWNLSKHAEGNYFLFIDADVTMEKDAVGSALYEIQNKNADILSVFPKQIILSFGEKAVVPFLNWLLISFIPVKFISSPKYKSLAGANGQFILWKKETYEKSGGHSAVKNEIVEDIEIAKYLKKNGYNTFLLLSNDLVFCRMYNSFKEAVSGFSKNIYPASASSPLLFIFNILFIVLSNLLPLILMFYNEYYIGLILIIILQRVIVSIVSSQNIFMNILLYPLQMLMLLYISIRSVVHSRSGRSVWKGRTL